MRFLLCLFLYALPLFSADAESFDELCERVLPSVFEIAVLDFNLDNACYVQQACIIDPRGYMLTASYHFQQASFECAEALWVDNEGSPHDLPITSIDIHPEFKIALIKIEHPYGGRFPCLALSSSPPRKGDWVLRVSRNKFARVGHPYVGQVLEYHNGEGVIGMGCYGRTPGAPFIDLKGDVLGIHTYSDERESFFTSTFQLKEWIDSILRD